MNPNSISSKLQDLFDLFKSGALSQEEFDLLKSELLNDEISKDGAITVVKDRDTIIKDGIEIALKGDYNEAIGVLTKILNQNNSNDLIHNRGILYLTYCLCENKVILKEISHRFSSIDFNILKQHYQPTDEQIALKITEYIVKNRLNEVLSQENPAFQIKRLIDSHLSNDYFTNNSNYQIAELWHLVGCQQVKLGRFSKALVSLEKSHTIIPDDVRYLNMCSEIKGRLNTQRRKKKRNAIFAFLSIIVILIFITASNFVYPYYEKYSEEKEMFLFVKRTNKMEFYQFYYLDRYPEGRYVLEVKKLMEIEQKKADPIENAK